MGGWRDPGLRGLGDSGATSGATVMLLSPFWVQTSSVYEQMC